MAAGLDEAEREASQVRQGGCGGRRRGDYLPGGDLHGQGFSGLQSVPGTRQHGVGVVTSDVEEEDEGVVAGGEGET